MDAALTNLSLLADLLYICKKMNFIAAPGLGNIELIVYDYYNSINDKKECQDLPNKIQYDQKIEFPLFDAMEFYTLECRKVSSNYFSVTYKNKY
jgi:hypothetical protein